MTDEERDMLKPFIEELKAEVLYQITENRRQGRNMTDDERQACREAYTDELQGALIDAAYIEGRDSGYLFALSVFDKAIDNMLYGDKEDGQEETVKEKPMGCGIQFPHFGADYPDAVCIDGYLWDLDSGEPNGDGIDFRIGGDDPCPVCNTQEWLKRVMENEEFVNEESALAYVEEIKEKYGDYACF